MFPRNRLSFINQPNPLDQGKNVIQESITPKLHKEGEMTNGYEMVAENPFIHK